MNIKVHNYVTCTSNTLLNSQDMSCITWFTEEKFHMFNCIFHNCLETLQLYIMKKNIDIFAFYEYNHYAINYPVFKIIASDKELYHYKTCLHLGLSDFIMPSLATPQINLQLI